VTKAANFENSRRRAASILKMLISSDPSCGNKTANINVKKTVVYLQLITGTSHIKTAKMMNGRLLLLTDLLNYMFLLHLADY